jgi:hypothetical protein
MADNVSTTHIQASARVGGIKIGGAVAGTIANTASAVNSNNVQDLPTLFNNLLVALRAVGLIA